jgi:diguanylate cyclase (GGDEF)-like protein
MIQSVVDVIKHASGTVGLFELAVAGLKAISGFDRVMAYRFDKDGHGEVIAEVVEPQLETYLGLRYPAADVPPQARRLTVAQPVGRIVDVNYQPVPLLVDPALQDDSPLDLTLSALRSVSPYHREYLRNMNVAACLTIGLTDGTELWGMLICQHTTPRVVKPPLRAAARIIGQVVSMLLVNLSKADVDTQRLKRIELLRALMDRLAAAASLPEGLTAAERELLMLVDASGAAISLSGKRFSVGRVPASDVVDRAAAKMRPDAGDDLLAIDDLGLRFPGFASCTSEGSGALLLPLDPGNDDWILWFRSELTRTVVWGGNPAEPVSVDPANGRLSPRTSFAAWKELVTGRSAPWAEADLKLARELRSAIAVEIAKRNKAELFELRYHDPLTGLPNRRMLQERIEKARTGTWVSATLLFLDIDVTKEVNETMGYAAGDLLLIEVARRLVLAAGPENLAARLGGDEFVVLCRDQRAVDEVGERIRRLIEAPFEISGRWWHVSPGIGTAVLDDSSAVDLVGAADSAMQAARITIEAKRKAEAQRQKMETLGRTMGGMAHEINNMLQPVTLIAADIIDSESVVGEIKEQLEIVLDCSRKARQIIGDMLAFSRPSVSTTEVHDPVALLHDSLPMFRKALPPNIVVLTRIAGTAPRVKINRTTFAQILMNLVTNAAAAMNGNGELVIVLEEELRGATDAKQQPHRFVRLQVIDTGCGMDRATLERVYEPFFTTKPVGQGTGLGLSVVYGLVREMSATITIESEPGCGTTVTILIPGHDGGKNNGVDIDH